MCNLSLLLALPEDVFTVVSGSLAPKDVCSLSLCCKNLNSLATSDKVWLAQCHNLGVVPSQDLLHWRNGVSSYKCLCKFLFTVKPLTGIWVHQNPELGNVVYVMPGFLSVVGCRIIPQELGPLGIQQGPLLWAPVFEIIADTDGSMAFFLHGRERDANYLYPATLNSIHNNCTMLLLEVEPKQRFGAGNLLHSKSLVHHIHTSDAQFSRRIRRTDRVTSKSQRVPETTSPVSFYNLGFGDRRKLLELVADHVRLQTPNLASGLLFSPAREDNESFQKDVLLMSNRRLLLMKIYKFGEGCTNSQEVHRLSSNPTEMELTKVKKSLDCLTSFGSVNRDVGHSCSPKKRTVAAYFKERLKLILGRSSPLDGSRIILRYGSSSKESSKHSKFQEFVRSADTMRLTLCAKSVKLLTYRAWPNMHDNQFALYKLPTPLPVTGQEYAGLWGGTFGWPPGIPADDKPGKALFFLSLSYEVSDGQRILIATKILEGTHYVLHPNGSAMFVVKIDEISSDPFPWSIDGDSSIVDVKHAYNGEGIANGYGFRYPGFKPGSLFVIQDGLLAFVWKETKAILTLQRLNLQELLKKGERVLALPPIMNFAYLTKSYSNVFTGFSNTTRCKNYARPLPGMEHDTSAAHGCENGCFITDDGDMAFYSGRLINLPHQAAVEQRFDEERPYFVRMPTEVVERVERSERRRQRQNTPVRRSPRFPRRSPRLASQ